MLLELSTRSVLSHRNAGMRRARFGMRPKSAHCLGGSSAKKNVPLIAQFVIIQLDYKLYELTAEQLT
jgi:hypothetical protein